MKWTGGKHFLVLGASVLALIGMMDPASAAGPPIVADHTVVEKYRDIPQYWIDEVKKMWLNVPGESHSSGYRKGLDFLENLDPRFQVNRTEDNADPEPYTDQHLRVSGHRRDNGGYWSYGAGEGNWYTNPAGIENIKAHIAYSNTHNLTIAAIGFGWCWDMTWHNEPGGSIDSVYHVHWAGSSEGGPEGDLRWGLDAGDQVLTGNSVSMDTYLSATQQYIDFAAANGFPTKVFFTTGPADGYSGESGYQRHLKHRYIRDYVNSHEGILFDYADILQWGDDGTQETETWTDYSNTLQTFPKIHSNNMLDFGGGYTEDGDHIGERGALRLGKAMWWMLARIAGWDGVSADPPPTDPPPTDPPPTDPPPTDPPPPDPPSSSGGGGGACSVSTVGETDFGSLVGDLLMMLSPSIVLAARKAGIK
jgi:hypothetical protein